MIKIIPYTPAHKENIKTLNYEWLEKYFYVEKSDAEQLSDPQLHIIDKGGHIYFATFDDKIVGTASLIKMNESEYELAKMAVTEKYKGLGIGKKLLEYCIEKAKDLGAVKLSLYSNTKLLAAINLYTKLGFKEIAMATDVHYERANIMMEKYL